MTTATDSYVQTLLSDLRAGDPELQRHAILALGEVGETAAFAVPDLARALEDPEQKYFAALALGGIGPAAKEAVSALSRALTDFNIVVRWSAANSLGDLGPAAAAAAPALIRAVQDLHVCVKCFYGPERQGVTAATVRCAAARALRQIGPRAVEVLEELRQVLRNAFGPLKTEIERTIVALEALDRSSAQPDPA